MQQFGRWIVTVGPWPWICLAIIDRIIVVALFGAPYVTTDDAIMWHAAIDYANGNFYGPYYYGQNYGPMLEALLAAPFVRIGAPVHVILPSVSSFLALVPYWSFALWFHHKGQWSASLFMASIPLLLPVEFGMMTTIPRGFVNGLALLAFLPWTADLRNIMTRGFLVGAVCSIAWFVNANTLVFSITFVTYSMFADKWNWRRSASIFLGALAGLGLFVSAQYWCIQHPDRIVHKLSGTEPHFELVRIIEGLSNLDAHFKWLMPILWPYGGLLGFWLIVLAAIAMIRNERALGLSLLASIVLICLSLTTNKVHDGLNTPIYSMSRMFLCLPLLLAWGNIAFDTVDRSEYQACTWCSGIEFWCNYISSGHY